MPNLMVAKILRDELNEACGSKGPFPGIDLQFWATNAPTTECTYAHHLLRQFLGTLTEFDADLDARVQDLLDPELYFTGDDNKPIICLSHQTLPAKGNGSLMEISADPLGAEIPKFPLVALVPRDFNVSGLDKTWLEHDRAGPVYNQLFNSHPISKAASLLTVSPAMIVFWTRRLMASPIESRGAIITKQEKGFRQINACATLLLNKLQTVPSRVTDALRSLLSENPVPFYDFKPGCDEFEGLKSSLNSSQCEPLSSKDILKCEIREWMLMAKLITDCALKHYVERRQEVQVQDSGK